MNDVSVVIYLILFVMLFAATFAYMFRLMGSTLDSFNKASIGHPELQGVKPGDELLGVKFKGYEELSLDEVEKYPMVSAQRTIEDIEIHRDLQDRINELEDDDEDEGDGDIPAKPYVGSGI